MVSIIECDMDWSAMWNATGTSLLCEMRQGLVSYVECDMDRLAMWNEAWTG